MFYTSTSGVLLHAGRSPHRMRHCGAGAREADRVTWLGIYVNVALFVIKFAAGFVGHSAAMIADAGHTLSDLVSDAGKRLFQMRSCATLMCSYVVEHLP
jgi:hypothetical protein